MCQQTLESALLTEQQPPPQIQYRIVTTAAATAATASGVAGNGSGATVAATVAARTYQIAVTFPESAAIDAELLIQKLRAKFPMPYTLEWIKIHGRTWLMTLQCGVDLVGKEMPRAPMFWTVYQLPTAAAAAVAPPPVIMEDGGGDGRRARKRQRTSSGTWQSLLGGFLGGGGGGGGGGNADVMDEDM